MPQTDTPDATDLSEVGKRISAATRAALEASKQANEASRQANEAAARAIQELLDSDTSPADTAEESATDLGGDFIPLVEKAVRRDGTVPLKLIAPGWGSSGYYGAAMLERDGPKVFTSGTKMYWDHPTVSEESERPERSLRDLAAELVSPARWEAAGPAGPGLYADAKVFGGFKESVEELAPHIGVSIRALGKGREGEVEGKAGKVIESIVAAKSVDFVTAPGAGGQVLQLFEAARGGRAQPHQPQQPQAQTPKEQEVTISEQEAQALREANTAAVAELQRLRERLLLTEARELVTETLRQIELPDAARARVLAAQIDHPVVKDGAIDREATAAQVKEAAQAERAYIQAVAPTGAIRGMGSTDLTGMTETATPEQTAAVLEEAFRALGLDEQAAKLAAAGR